MVPVRGPVADGAKVTAIWQALPGASDAPQVLVWVASPAAAMLVMLSEAEPELAIVTLCGKPARSKLCAAKFRLVADRLTATAGVAVPVPVRVTACGLSGASPVMMTVPFRVPVAAGANIIWIGQLAAAGKVLGQALL